MHLVQIQEGPASSDGQARNGISDAPHSRRCEKAGEGEQPLLGIPFSSTPDHLQKCGQRATESTRLRCAEHPALRPQPALVTRYQQRKQTIAQQETKNQQTN
jgi:hypothetical protein